MVYFSELSREYIIQTGVAKQKNLSTLLKMIVRILLL